MASAPLYPLQMWCCGGGILQCSVMVALYHMQTPPRLLLWQMESLWVWGLINTSTIERGMCGMANVNCTIKQEGFPGLVW